MTAQLSRVYQDGPDLVIDIRARMQWGLIAFMSVWLPLWALGEVFVIIVLATGQSGGAFTSLFLMLWLILWTLGGWTACRAVLWTFFGRERTRLSVERIHLTRKHLFWSRERTLPRSAVRQLRLSDRRERVSRGSDEDDKGAPDPSDFTEGQLIFDTEDETIGMGVDLDPDEARKLHATLLSVFPELSGDAPAL